MVEALEHHVQAKGIINAPEELVPKAVDRRLFQRCRFFRIEVWIPPVCPELLVDLLLRNQAAFKPSDSVLKKGEVFRKMPVEDGHGRNADIGIQAGVHPFG